MAYYGPQTITTQISQAWDDGVRLLQQWNNGGQSDNTLRNKAVNQFNWSINRAMTFGATPAEAYGAVMDRMQSIRPSSLSSEQWASMVDTFAQTYMAPAFEKAFGRTWTKEYPPKYTEQQAKDWIDQFYRDGLGRDISSEEMSQDHYAMKMAMLRSGENSVDQIWQQIKTSPEGQMWQNVKPVYDGVRDYYKELTGKDIDRSTAIKLYNKYGNVIPSNNATTNVGNSLRNLHSQINGLYNSELGRGIKPEGFYGKMDQVLNGTSVAEVHNQIKQSDEYKLRQQELGKERGDGAVPEPEQEPVPENDGSQNDQGEVDDGADGSGATPQPNDDGATEMPDDTNVELAVRSWATVQPKGSNTPMYVYRVGDDDYQLYNMDGTEGARLTQKAALDWFNWSEGVITSNNHTSPFVRPTGDGTLVETVVPPSPQEEPGSSNWYGQYGLDPNTFNRTDTPYPALEDLEVPKNPNKTHGTIVQELNSDIEMYGNHPDTWRLFMAKQRMAGVDPTTTYRIVQNEMANSGWSGPDLIPMMQELDNMVLPAQYKEGTEAYKEMLTQARDNPATLVDPQATQAYAAEQNKYVINEEQELFSGDQKQSYKMDSNVGRINFDLGNAMEAIYGGSIDTGRTPTAGQPALVGQTASAGQPSSGGQTTSGGQTASLAVMTPEKEAANRARIEEAQRLEQQKLQEYLASTGKTLPTEQTSLSDRGGTWGVPETTVVTDDTNLPETAQRTQPSYAGGEFGSGATQQQGTAGVFGYRDSPASPPQQGQTGAPAGTGIIGNIGDVNMQTTPSTVSGVEVAPIYGEGDKIPSAAQGTASKASTTVNMGATTPTATASQAAEDVSLQATTAATAGTTDAGAAIGHITSADGKTAQDLLKETGAFNQTGTASTYEATKAKAPADMQAAQLGQLSEGAIIDPNALPDEAKAELTKNAIAQTVTEKRQEEAAAVGDVYKPTDYEKEATIYGQMDKYFAGMGAGNGVPVWAKPVVDAVEGRLAARGIARNSNVARDSLYSAIVQSAMPMAQADAQGFQQKWNTEFSNDEKTILFNATNQANIDVANATFAQTLLRENAQKILQKDIANLNNEQRTRELNYQAAQSIALSDQAADNAAKQFNAASQNQVDQFMMSLASNIDQQNKTRDADLMKSKASITADLDKVEAQLKTQASIAEAGYSTDRAKTVAALIADIRKNNSQVLSQASITNATLLADRQKTKASLEAELSKTNAQLETQASLTNAQMKNDLLKNREALSVDINKLQAQIDLDAKKTEANIKADLEKTKAALQADLDKSEASLKVDAAKNVLDNYMKGQEAQAKIDMARDQFNSQMEYQIDQSNLLWRRQINTLNNAAANAAAQADAANYFNLSNQAMGALWQEIRDQAYWDWAERQNQASNGVSMASLIAQQNIASRSLDLEQTAMTTSNFWNQTAIDIWNSSASTAEKESRLSTVFSIASLLTD